MGNITVGSQSSALIINPQNIQLPGREMAGILNDLSVKLVRMSNEYQKAVVENQLIKKKLNTLISINIINAIRDKPKGLRDISNDTRIDESDLKVFLDDLIKNNKVELKEDQYHLKNG